MTGFVYFIERADGDAVKIGWSETPRARCANLSVGNPKPHKLLGYVPGTKEHEREVHEICSNQRIRGEWFRKEGHVLLFLDHLPPLKAQRGLKVVSDTASTAHIRRAISINGSKAGKKSGVLTSIYLMVACRVSNHWRRNGDCLRKATDGEVSRSDLRPDLFAPKIGAAA
jgi:hypothetical protein